MQDREQHINLWRINRNIVECKGDTECSCLITISVLIETSWNVKSDRIDEKSMKEKY